MNNTESYQNIEKSEINETKVIPYFIIKKKNLQVIKNKTNDVNFMFVVMFHRQIRIKMTENLKFEIPGQRINHSFNFRGLHLLKVFSG